MNDYLFIALLIYMTINGFGAGAYYISEGELDWSTFFGILIYLAFGTLIIIAYFIFEAATMLFKWFIAVSQIKFWWNYYTGTFDKVSGTQLLDMNDSMRYRNRDTFTNRHIKRCMALLNRQYEFDFKKFEEERNTVDVFKEPNETYTLNKSL